MRVLQKVFESLTTYSDLMGLHRILQFRRFRLHRKSISQQLLIWERQGRDDQDLRFHMTHEVEVETC